MTMMLDDDDDGNELFIVLSGLLVWLLNLNKNNEYIIERCGKG